MMFTICPECGNDKLKTKSMDAMTYDPHTTRVTVDERYPTVEYHCRECGWTVQVENPEGIFPERMESDLVNARPGKRAGIRRERGE